MKRIFAELGRRLARFRSDDADAVRAARAIAADMLSPRALAAWTMEWRVRYPTLPVPRAMQKNVLVIMAGNIPFVGVQDLVCVLAAGHRAIVKPSSKDPGTMLWAVSELLDIAPDLPVTLFSPAAFEASDAPSPTFRPDAVIAMGTSDTVRALEAKYAGIPMLLRGNRSSLAVLDGTEGASQLAALADDILSFSGLGCRNVSLVFVPRGYNFVPLQTALSQYDTSPKYRNNYRQTRALLQMASSAAIDCSTCLLVEQRDFPAAISRVNYSFYDSAAEVEDWIRAHDAEIQCVASSRTVAVGHTQHPSLADYPDGRDTMEFLASLTPASGTKTVPAATTDPKRPTLISIVGPTGSGKTDLAIAVATRLGAPILSTDSRQVYRGMAIGSAQPTAGQLKAVPHYFIADREPTRLFSCADFEREALALLEKLFAQHEYVVAVGGSGLYVDALCHGLDPMPDADLELRERLNDKLKHEGLEPLLEELREKDPEYHAAVDRQNPARVVRALEVYLQTERPFSSFRSSSRPGNNPSEPNCSQRSFDIVKIGLDLPRAELYNRIDTRVDAMMAGGLEAEARKLHHLKHLPALQTVGYKELFAHFDGEHDLARAVELIKRNSRRYAKRQLTWFRRDGEIWWFAPSEMDAILEKIVSLCPNFVGRRQNEE